MGRSGAGTPNMVTTCYSWSRGGIWKPLSELLLWLQGLEMKTQDAPLNLNFSSLIDVVFSTNLPPCSV